MTGFDFIATALGMRSPRYNFGGGSTSAGPTAQQQALATEQAQTNANLNLEENDQRKTILNALQGTRVFRGSALSRQAASNVAPPTGPTAAPSANQQSPPIIAAPGTSILDAAAAAPNSATNGVSGGRGTPTQNPGRPAGR